MVRTRSEKMDGISKKYLVEVHANCEILGKLKKIIQEHKNTTLLYAAKDEGHNEAVVLQRLLHAKAKKTKAKSIYD